MMAEIFKFPYNAQRRLHSRKPRKSKNGTPEERAAKAAAEQGPPADVVALSVVPDAEPAIDGRKLRGSPLRDKVAVISFGATVVGKMRTAELKGEPLTAIPPEIRQGWLELLERAIEATISVNIGLDQAMETLKVLKAREANVLTPAEFEEVYSQLRPVDQARIDQLISSFKSENSDSAVNLPDNGLGQSVLNLTSIGQSVLKQGRVGPTSPKHHEAVAHCRHSWVLRERSAGVLGEK